MGGRILIDYIVKLQNTNVNGGAISGHRGGVKSGQLRGWRLKQKAPFAQAVWKDRQIR
jgi:hypothetical protein